MDEMNVREETVGTGSSKDHSKFYLVLAVITYIFNFADLDFTLFALSNIPGSYEANPFFQSMLRSPALAAAFKLLAVPLLLFAMYRFRERPLARIGLWVCFIVYSVNFALQTLALARFALR